MRKINNSVELYYKRETDADWNYYYTYLNVNYKYITVGYYSETIIDDLQTTGNYDYFHYYGPSTFTAGTVTSPAIDIGAKPYGTGYISWVQDLPQLGTAINLYTQTSDDGETWSEPWEGPYTNYTGQPVSSKNKRYIRFKAQLTTDDYNYSPVLKSVKINYPGEDPDGSIVSEMKVYPTIAGSKVNFTYTLLNGVKKIKAEIKDSTGKSSRSIDVSSAMGEFDTQIDVTGLANGVYFIRVYIERIDGTGETFVKKFVVKK